MAYDRLKTAITQFEHYVADNPNVDTPTQSRLMLLRDRLIEFIALEGKQTEPITKENEWQDIVDLFQREIAVFEAKHPELTEKLDQIITVATRAGI